MAPCVGTTVFLRTRIPLFATGAEAAETQISAEISIWKSVSLSNPYGKISQGVIGSLMSTCFIGVRVISDPESSGRVPQSRFYPTCIACL